MKRLSALLAAFLVSCFGRPIDFPTPVDPVRIWVSDLTEAQVPGLRESIQESLDAWCQHRKLCGKLVAEGVPPYPTDWIVTYGGDAAGPSVVASTDYAKKRIYLFARQSDGDVIRFVELGQCEHGPTRDVELRTVVAHELGHAFGLHHVEDKRDIMRPATRCDGLLP